MVLRIVDASELRVGGYAIFDTECYVIRNIDSSKTGKHGAHKCRFEAISLIGDKKKIALFPGNARVEVPMVDKRKAQVLALAGENVSIMDADSFENFELPIPEELKDQIVSGVNVEYWDIEGRKIIKRVM
jgi:translation initiation factor 5A